MFLRYKGKTKTVWMPKKASTEFTEGSVVQIAAGDTGRVTPAASGTAVGLLMGVIKKSVASSDSDYADNTQVPVEIPMEKNVEWVADATGTAAATHIGTEVDLSNATTVNVAGTTTKAVLVRDTISTSKITVLLKLNGSY